MSVEMRRRRFLKLLAGGSMACVAGRGLPVFGAGHGPARLVSPGCRGTRVKVARIYMGGGLPYWPRPDLDFQREIRFYESRFERMRDELSDVDFVVDELVTSADQVKALRDRLREVDGILAIHLKMGVGGMLRELLRVGRPTTVFARPYSGHEWTGWGRLQKTELGSKLACKLTSDFTQLAAAIRPFRAIHHLREAKVLDLTRRFPSGYASDVREKFGTEIKQIGLERMMDACRAIDDGAVEEEARRWQERAVAVVEPSEEEILKSCRLALAFERVMDEERATVMTADCYGTMYEPLCQSYAFPCLGFARLNDMGLGGICQSDLQSAMTHVLFQALSGRPGFIGNPTVDESGNAIILAHCLGTPRMDGPDGPAAPYRLRSVLERRAGVTPQVDVRVGQEVTQAILFGTGSLPYFTGRIVEAPREPRGCRTKAVVEVDGDVEYLYRHWADGVHRVLCYGDLTEELEDFCRFTDIDLVDEAARPEKFPGLGRPPLLVRIGASMTDVDSEADGYAASLAIDGRPDTFWHTPWGAGAPGFPHHVTFDLGRQRTVAGFIYLPRQDMSNGRIADYEFCVSNDGANWETAGRGSFPNDAGLKRMELEKPREARYVKLVALSEVSGHEFTSMAEFDVILAE